MKSRLISPVAKRVPAKDPRPRNQNGEIVCVWFCKINKSQDKLFPDCFSLGMPCHVCIPIQSFKSLKVDIQTLFTQKALTIYLPVRKENLYIFEQLKHQLKHLGSSIGLWLPCVFFLFES